MIEIRKKSNCSGCYACINACPKQCIEMKVDDEGFCYPLVNKTKCINCGLCEKKCPIITLNVREKFEVKAYAAYNKDESIRLESSSGGIFTLLAEYIISLGGVVFGAAFDADCSVKHIAVETIDDLYKLRGAKYLQSQIGETYSRVKAALKDGRYVLFTGTPCQIEGLVSYLGKSYDKLYTQDIICHGCPSPMVWGKYVEFREKKSASQTQRTFFRHKKYGWKMYSVLFEFSNKTEYIQIFNKDLYMTSFLKNLSLRPSCYDCHFKKKERVSDITLGDFWGVNHVFPEMDDDKGTSLVIIQSEKGQRLFDAIERRTVSTAVGLDDGIQYNSAYLQSCLKPYTRNMFMKKIVDGDFEQCVKKYSVIRKSLIVRILRKIKSISKKIICRGK